MNRRINGAYLGAKIRKHTARQEARKVTTQALVDILTYTDPWGQLDYEWEQEMLLDEYADELFWAQYHPRSYRFA
jgi:hypothetical protein